MAYETREEILKLGEMDPELKSALDNSTLPPVDYAKLESFVEFANARSDQMATLMGDLPDSIKINETTYTTEDGTKNRAKVFYPAQPPKQGSPLIVVYHGGGFCIGFPEGEEQTCRNLVEAFGAVCVSAAYRLAPKFPFPYAIKDAWDALKWAAANAKSLGADPSLGFLVGGTSAGGNISAALAHIARDEKLSPPLTGQYLAIPALCPPDKMPEQYRDRLLSYEQNKDAPVLPQAAIDMFMGGYKPDENDGVHYAVFNHPKGHADLPPAFFQIDGLDPLRDEALIYESVLRKDYGIKTKFNVYPGMPHGHWGFFPSLKQSKTFRKEQVEGIGWLLGMKPRIENVDTEPNPTTV